MLTPESIIPGAEKKMVGSIFICEADSLETVHNLMVNDVYYTSGVVSVSLHFTLMGFPDATVRSGTRRSWSYCR